MLFTASPRVCLFAAQASHRCIMTAGASQAAPSTALQQELAMVRGQLQEREEELRKLRAAEAARTQELHALQQFNDMLQCALVDMKVKLHVSC